VDGIVRSGALTSKGGKVNIKPRTDYPTGWNPADDTHLTIWECTQHLVKRYIEEGEAAAAELVTKLGTGRSEEAKNLAYRLFSVAEKKGWAEEARPYNELVTAWPEIQRKAAGISGEGPQKTLDIESERRKKK
jgi:putative DNA methylase